VSEGGGAGGAMADGARCALSDWLELIKARLTGMVIMSAGAGFVLGAGPVISWSGLAWALGGIGLVAAGAAALNQYMERDLDARMDRTRDRPLPRGRISPRSAKIAGIVLSIAGVGALAVASNPLTAFLSAASWSIYLFIYTPMKRWTTLNTLVGAVPGALPPVLGWAAAAGDIGDGAWLPFVVMVLWQMPHFLSIAWLCRSDYARAGFWMLPVVDPLGWGTGGWSVLCATLLVPVGWVAMRIGMAGPVFALVAGLAGLVLVRCAWRFAVRRGDGEARSLFLYSLCYLPIVLLGLAISGRQ